MQSWERVLATRKQLLQLAGLPPDASHDVEPYDVDYDYDDSGDFDDLSPPRPPPAKRPSRKAATPWPQLSAAIRFGRAKGRCERCRRPHGRLVFHLGDGRPPGGTVEAGRSHCWRTRPLRMMT
jgi:hypothetical protein